MYFPFAEYKLKKLPFPVLRLSDHVIENTAETTKQLTFVLNRRNCFISEGAVAITTPRFCHYRSVRHDRKQ